MLINLIKEIYFCKKRTHLVTVSIFINIINIVILVDLMSNKYYCQYDNSVITTNFVYLFIFQLFSFVIYIIRITVEIPNNITKYSLLMISKILQVYNLYIIYDSYNEYCNEKHCLSQLETIIFIIYIIIQYIDTLIPLFTILVFIFCPIYRDCIFKLVLVINSILLGNAPSRIYNLDIIQATHHDISNECYICLENYIVGDNIMILLCMHKYHVNCIRPWLAINNTCPVCRIDINNNHIV